MNLGIIIKLEVSQTFKIKFDLINIVKIPKYDEGNVNLDLVEI